MIPDDERARLVHDIMSPLAAIVGYAELLRTRDDEQIRRDAPLHIVEAATRLKTAVQALVDERGRRSGTDGREPAGRTQPGARSPGQARRRILVVDDDSVVRTLLRTTLPADAYDVLEASDGETALRLMHAGPPALVVLDWQLPVRSGADVLAELKRHVPALPVLILTGAHDPEPRRHAQRLGADAFLTKPFSPLELLQAIDRLLGE
jgi:CheY-like chemotaxis protein